MTDAKPTRLRGATDEYRALADRLRAGGGDARVAKMHAKGQLSPRERVAHLLDAEFQMALGDAQSLAVGRDHQFIEPAHLCW